MSLPSMQQQRDFLKDDLRQQIDFYLTDQNRGVRPPPLQRPPRPEQTVINCPRLTAAPPLLAPTYSMPSANDKVTATTQMIH